MGNNVLVRREAYRSIGGFDAIGCSITEDRELLRVFRKKKLAVAAADPFVPTARTLPLKRPADYWRQLIRWAGGGFAPGSNLVWFALPVAVQNVIFLLFVSGAFSHLTGLLSVVNFFLTWLLVTMSFKKTGSVQSLFSFIPFYALFLIESLALGAALFLRLPVVWKERRLSSP
jgi:cellulose synthase/poly-beta-1,6-N-acetylglucosamine synthase-like glycosyltransferase